MLTGKKIGFLGSGNLAEALIKGLLSSGKLNAAQITASDVASDRLAYMASTYEIKVSNNNSETVDSSDVVLLTIKPKDIGQAVSEAASGLNGNKLIISAVAGVTTRTIQDLVVASGVSRVVPIVRVMPNTPATVREGITAVCAGAGANANDVELAKAVFEAVGTVIAVDEEKLMDVVTGLSGSGPAYVFLFMEALAEAGVDLGLDGRSARLLAVQTALGAARLALESPLELVELRRMVSSPGGTTIEGLKALEDGGFKQALVKAVEAATRRATEIAGGR